jgi:hypothetical protein
MVGRKEGRECGTKRRKRNDEYWMKGKIGRKKEGKKGSGIVEERREIVRGKEGTEDLSEETEGRKGRR